MSANRLRMLFAMAAMAFAIPAAAQTGTISGKIVNATAVPISGAQVTASSGIRTVASGLSDANGDYRLSNIPAGTYTVRARLLGYAAATQENVNVTSGFVANVNLTLNQVASQLEQVITTASRAPEKVIDAPASVSVINSAEVAERASINIADHVAALPGIDVARGGLVRSNIVARGFNNIFSGALMTLTDNRFAFVPSLRVNIPYLSTTTNEDIERIEVVLGPGAALYGPNTASGVMALFTKSPFSSQGTTVTVDGGNQSVLRGSVRTAWAPSPKFGFKASYEVFQGKEWETPPADSIGDPNDPSDDEKKPRDPDIKRQGGEIRVDFRPTPSSEIIANYGRSKAGSAVEPTGLGPAQVKDWVYQTYQLRARSKQTFAQVFLNTSDAGGTYLLRAVRPTTNCPDVLDPACIIDKSSQLAAQIQQGFDLGSRARLLAGVDYINTMPETDSTINGRNENDDTITEVGGYLHSVFSLSPKFEVTAAARVDKHSRLEDPVFSPRLALVFKPLLNQNFRVTYNRAFSTPSTNNLFLDLVAAGNALFNIRALGTPEDGLRYNRSCTSGAGGLCMKVFAPFAGGATGFVPANPYANSFAVARTGVIASLTAAFTQQFIAAGLPAAAAAQQAGLAAAATAGYLGSLTPTADQVGTTLIIPPVGGAAGFPVSPSQLVDIDRPKPTIHNTIEVGYKGIIADRLQLSLDVWHEKRENFVGPLQLETPLVVLGRPALQSYLASQLTTFFPTIGLPAAAAATVAGQLAGALPGTNFGGGACSLTAPANCPIGVVTFDSPNAGGDAIVAYRSYAKDLNLWGSDLGAELLLDQGFSVQGTYSWVNKQVFSKESLGTREDVSLNAPKNKHSVALKYRNEESGLSGELRERHVDSFDTFAFVGGKVDAYTLVDAGISFRPSILNGALISINGTNILNKRHRQFSQGALLGRLIITRLQVTF